MRKTLAALALAAITLSSPALAVAVTESGDAGETLASAQFLDGPVDSIAGALADLGSNGVPIDDIDMYKLYVSNTSGFGVAVSQGLSVNGDGQLFLFNDLGQLLAFNDDTADSLDPHFYRGFLAGRPAGFYFLGYSLYNSDPQFTGGALSGWTRSPGPFQTGSYTLSLMGIPEPATWLLMIAGVAAVGAAMRRKRTVRVGYAA